MKHNQKPSSKKKCFDSDTKLPLFLQGQKVIAPDNEFLICPYCALYHVEYYNNTKSWMCSTCDQIVIIEDIQKASINVSENEKYLIYKRWGFEAFQVFMQLSERRAQDFVSSFFEKCCTQKGEKCLYNNYFEEFERAKKYTVLERQFQAYIEHCQDVITDIQSIKKKILNSPLEKSAQFPLLRICNEYLHGFEQITRCKSNFAVAIASIDLTVGQKVYINDEDSRLVAVLGEQEIEAFCWNNAEKDQLVVLMSAPPRPTENATMEIKEKIKELITKIRHSHEEYPFIALERICKLKLTESEFEIATLILKMDPCYQNQLGKALGIDSKKCSRILKVLLDDGIITRKIATNNSARTFQISINEDLYDKQLEELIKSLNNMSTN